MIYIWFSVKWLCIHDNWFWLSNCTIPKHKQERFSSWSVDATKDRFRFASVVSISLQWKWQQFNVRDAGRNTEPCRWRSFHWGKHRWWSDVNKAPLLVRWPAREGKNAMHWIDEGWHTYPTTFPYDPGCHYLFDKTNRPFNQRTHHGWWFIFQWLKRTSERSSNDRES